MPVERVTDGRVGDPDLPTRKQVQAWLDSIPACSAGVVGCIMKHISLNPREHVVQELCYWWPLDKDGIV